MDETEIAALTERVLSLSPAEQMGFMLGMLEKVSDERDGWKATVTRMMEDEEALIAERDRRLAELAHARTSAVVANDAADAAAEAVGAMAEKLTALLAERDRLRAITRDVWAALWHADPGEVELLSAEHEAMLPGVVRAALLAAVQHARELELQAGDRERHLRDALEDTRAERDRLRAAVARCKEFAESEILDRVSAELGVDLRRQLDRSGEATDE